MNKLTPLNLAPDSSLSTQAIGIGLMKKTGILAVALLGIASASHATVVVTNQWLLGEGGAYVASVGGVNLTATGSSTDGLGVATGSTVSQSFTNPINTGAASPAATNYLTATLGIGQVANWGVSAWINPSVLPNGVATTEMGILQLGPINLEVLSNGSTTSWLVHHPGSDLTNVTSGVPLPAISTPFQVSYVNENGSAKLYINGSSASVIARNSDNNILIGAMQGNIRGFNGLIDEVSVFTFSPGQFAPSDLTTLAVPEPSTALLGGIGMLGLLSRRRRS